MSKKIALTIGAVVVLAGGLLAFTMSGNEESNQSTTQNQANETQQNEEIVSGQANLVSLLERDEDLNCTFSYDDQNVSYEGQAYISGERMRGSFTMNGEQTFESELLRTNDEIYTWETSSNQGVVIESMSVESFAEDFDEEASETSIDPSQDYNVSCTAWSVDESVFEAPSDVEFVNLTEQTEDIQEQLENFNMDSAN